MRLQKIQSSAGTGRKELWFGAFALFIVLTLLNLTGCSTKQKTQEYIVRGSDSISVAALKKMVPATADSILDTSRALLLYALNKSAYADSTVPVDSALISELHEQLELHSPDRWSKEQSETALRLTATINNVVDSSHDSAAIDSLKGSITAMTGDSSDPLTLSFIASLDSLRQLDSVAADKKIDVLLGVLLDISEKGRGLFISYAMDTTSIVPPGQDSSMEEMVAGLVKAPDDTLAESETIPKSVRTARQAQLKADLSEQLLKKRPLTVIQDSIKTHLREIQALYKKKLKLYETMRGVVYITFHVAPDGSVEKCELYQSDIEHAEFTDALLEQCKEIGFSSVPEKYGVMTFNFPFEFSPEL